MAPRATVLCWRTSICAASPLRRHLKTSHGPKYQAKLDEAENQWQQRKRLVEEGKIPHLWDFFEERGFVKDVAG